MRRPFVVTFTVLATACHASSEAAPSEDSAPAADAMDATGDTSAEAAVDAGADAEAEADAPACPPTRPILGSDCHLPRTLQCSYPDICPQAPSPGGNDVLTCISGAWTADDDAYMLDCPSPPPEPHSECLCAAHQLNEGCITLHCVDGEPSAWVICDDESKQWLQLPLPCNPPGADAGDADADETDAAPDADAEPEADAD